VATETKPERAAAPRESTIGLTKQGLDPSGTVHWNLIAPELMLAAARRNEGEFAEMGPFVARTSPHTGRSPNDKFVVKESSSSNDVDWGKVNQPYEVEKYEALLADVRAYLNEATELFVEDLYCGADANYRLSVRYVSPNAWHMAFVRNMFIRPEITDLPDVRSRTFTVLHAPEFQADPASTVRAPGRSSF
jgi:phosphoenolpyruvate carboxykinase (ATP)